MKYWSNVCVEGHCFGEEDKSENNPCGRNVPSPFCLGNGICPHFAWADATERDASCFVPMCYILKDRIGIWSSEIYWKLRWWFWDCLWFNRRKVNEYFDSIKGVTAETCPTLAKWEEGKCKSQKRFEKWFSKVIKEAK